MYSKYLDNYDPCGFYSDELEEFYSSQYRMSDSISQHSEESSSQERINQNNQKKKIIYHPNMKKDLGIPQINNPINQFGQEQVCLNKQQDEKQSFNNKSKNCKKTQNQNLKLSKKKLELKYAYPKETKNMYYNLGQNLKSFIELNFDEQQKSQVQIKKFLEIPTRFGYRALKKCINQSSQLRQIVRIFFTQFGWARFFIINGRVDLEPYFRFKFHFLID